MEASMASAWSLDGQGTLMLGGVKRVNFVRSTSRNFIP